MGDSIKGMNMVTLKELKTTTKSLQSLIKIAKKQLLLVRITEAEKNYASGNFRILKDPRDLLK